MTARITPLSTPPNRNDPATFVPRTDTFLSELPIFGAEANALADEVQGLATQVATTGADIIAKVSAAAGSASSAASSASSAASSASSAATSATNAIDSAIQATRLNLGAKSSPPTVDNQGGALLTGAFYFDIPSGSWRGWDGTSWQLPIHSVAGVSSINGATGAVTIEPPHLLNFITGTY